MKTPKASLQPGPRYASLLQLLRTAETLWNVSRQFFARWDLSPSQFNILSLLSAEDTGCSQIDLSRKLIMHRSNVTGLVDRLEKRGLVRRAANPDDRRAWHVTLTKNGKELLKTVQPHYYRVAEDVWGNIPPEEAARLARQMTALSSRAEEMGAALNKQSL
jgi:DNA-binding MarR family transcriptional regulator